MRKSLIAIIINFSFQACDLDVLLSHSVNKINSISKSIIKLGNTESVSFEYNKLSIDNGKKIDMYLPILMFHHIEEVKQSKKEKFLYNLSFSPQKFEKFLKFFNDNNIETITFYGLADIILKHRDIPKKAVILTFDDGYQGQYEAFKYLKKYKMKGIFFIITSKPDSDTNYLNWNEISEMSKNGQEIGSHTVNHQNLTKLSKEKIIYELENSKKTLEEKLGKNIISFCYPSGEYDEEVMDITKKYYLFARTTEHGKYFSSEKIYEIPILRISPETSTESLKSWFYEDFKPLKDLTK